MTSSIFRNFASLTGAEALGKLITFAAFAYLARILGPTGFGYIEWCAAVLMCGSLVVDQGFSAYGAREIAKNPSQTSRLVGQIVTARFLFAILAYAMIAIFASLFVYEQVVFQLLLIYGLSLWVLPLFLQWVFQGHERMNLVALTQIIRQVVFAGVVVALVQTRSSMLYVGIAEVAAVVSAAAFSLWMYKHYFSGKLSFRPTLSRKLIREALPIGVSQMFWVLRMFGATFVMGLIATAEDTGYFAGAMRIYIALHTFVWLYYFNMLPTFSRAWEDRPEKLALLIKRSLGWVAAVSVIAGVVWVAAAPLVMTSAYGANFAPGASALQWLAGACIAAALSGHYRYGLIASGSQGSEMSATAIGSLFALVSIPIGYYIAGPSGAAASLFFAELVVLVLTFLFFKRALSAGIAPASRGNAEPIDVFRRASL